jgi:ribonucleoside-diphosphate reductase alpha subunit
MKIQINNIKETSYYYISQDMLEDDQDTEMFVFKRSGQREIVSFDKILNRIKILCNEANLKKVNPTTLVIKVIDQLKDGISTTKIDELSAEQCASMSSIHTDYNILAGRIIISNLHRNTSNSFSYVMNQLYQYHDKQGKHSPVISKELSEIVSENAEVFDEMCDYTNDYLIEYFGFKTLEKSYLMKINRDVVERPQHMWLRVSIGIHGRDLKRVKETYFYMSNKYFTHATPTLFNAGTCRPQLSSCFLIGMESDSIDGIFNTVKECASISKWAGGIGLHIHNIRATGSVIRGTNGASNGIVPMLKVFNNTAKYVDQCVVPETYIYTTDGPKQIQHCSMGQTKIYNILGAVETIQDVLEHPYTGEILSIESEHSIIPLQITPEHPIYVGKSDGEFEWLDAKDVGINDSLVFPIPKYSADISSITDEDCYMYGLILRYGSMKNTSFESGLGSISFHSLDKPYILNFVTDYFNRKCVEYKVDGIENMKIISWTRSIHLPFRYNDIYDGVGNKRIHSRWLNLPVKKSKYIIKGLLDNTITFTTTSYDLIEGIRFLVLKMGLLTTSYIRNHIIWQESERENHTKYYCLSIPPTREICVLMDIDYDFTGISPCKRVGDFLLSPIHKITTRKYDGILYDLQMKHQHDYLLHNGLVHNGGGKRNGSFAIYLEPWHADIEFFLDMRKNHGDEELKARDLFYALWIPDLFMERVKTDGQWTLMCPDECPGLADVYGEKFNELYCKYESDGLGRKIVKARELWFKVLDAQMETGTPYLLYKDACNKKSNQQNVGTIKSSNLCSEIVEYSDDKETAVCNLASIALPAFVDMTTNPDAPTIDYEKLHKVAGIITLNLNRIIDVNYYPTEKTRISNMRHRPIGIGVQGLADLFIMMNIPFYSEEAKVINRHIFETIYHGALVKSCEMASIDGPYETFVGSPASKGVLQFDLWSVDPGSSRYDWTTLKQSIIKDGLRNSLLLAPMPTASTSQILGYNECIEPITSNIYSRRTIAGEFIVANKYLMNDLMKLHLWNEKVKNSIIANHGSIQHLDMIPENIRDKYRTVWEIPMRHLIDMAAERGVFICQSQSLNLWLEDPNYSSLTSMHFYSWSKGLKTGIYYLRRRGRHQAQQFTIEPEKNVNEGQLYEETEEELCEMCSS